MASFFAALVSGLLFGLGLTVSQMINPAKVIAFIDVLGNFDPSLAFVMATAIPVTALGYALAARRHSFTDLRPRFQFTHPERDRSASGSRCSPVRHRLGAGRLLPWPGARRAWSHEKGEASLTRTPKGSTLLVVHECGKQDLSIPLKREGE